MTTKTEAIKTSKLALPIIFGELAQMLLHIIDTAMIGATGDDSYKQVAAAALAFSVIHLPFVFGIGMTISVSQLVSMAKGQGNHKSIAHFFFNGFWLCALFSVLIFMIIELAQPVLFHLGQDAEIAELASPFLRVMGFSIVPMLLFMTLKQFTDGLEHTRTAMFLSFVSVPFNVFLNWLFIFGNWGFPRMEMMGAAYATLITRSLAFVALGMVILRHKHFRKYIEDKSQWFFKKESIRELLRIGIPTSLQIGMEAGIFALSGIMVGTLGGKQLAAHQIALQCVSFTFMVSLGLAQAGSIRTSNAMGQGNWLRIHKIGKSTLWLALIYGCICALLFVLMRHILPSWFLAEGSGSNAEVMAIAAILLLYGAFFQISDATQAISAGLLRGIKDVKVPTGYIFIAYWILGLPIGFYLAKVQEMGAAGIWLGFIIGLSFSAISLSSRFFKKAKQNIAI